MTRERRLRPQRTTVRFGFWAGGVMGPFFFTDDEGVAIAVNGERYRHMPTGWLWPCLRDVDFQKLWFQQYCVTRYTSRGTLDVITGKFPGRAISLRDDRKRPARSRDLTPCDFFLKDYVPSIRQRTAYHTTTEGEKRTRRCRCRASRPENRIYFPLLNRRCC